MSDANRKARWDNVYTTKGENEVSWFQESPAPSLELIDVARQTADSAIIDIGVNALFRVSPERESRCDLTIFN